MKYHHNQKRGHSVNTFSINGNTYSIRLTDHAALRLKQRSLDLYQVVGSILSLGEKRILEYRDTGKDIFIMDKVNNFSIVFCVESFTIYIITCINSADCYIKAGTIAVEL